MTRHKIPSPRYEVCGSLDEALAFVKKAPFGYPFVVKADGLAAGKGTVVVEDAAEAKAVVEQIMAEKKFGSAGAKVVMEEFLQGEEVSFLVFSDGSRVVPMASVQDHKRALDGDKGPNTGGMGTVSPTTNISLDGHKRIMQEIVVPTIAGLAAEGRRFQGVLFAGLMMTEAGPKVLEFNARFGDPETQVIMARMRSDVVPILAAGARRARWARPASSGRRSRRSAWWWRARATPTPRRRARSIERPRLAQGVERRGRLPRGHEARGRPGQDRGRPRARA